MNKLLAMSVVGVSVAGGCAVAADLPVRSGGGVAALPVASPGYPETWTGFYAGFEGGGAWDRTSFNASPVTVQGATTAERTTDETPVSVLTPFARSFQPAIPGTTANGGVWGGFYGYNWQYGPIVGGLEANIDSTDIRSTSAFGPFVRGVTFNAADGGVVGALNPFNTLANQLRIDTLASVRGRLGYLVLPNLFLFGTGGLGFAHGDLTVVDTSGTFFPDRTSLNKFGWVAGAGAEYRLWEHVLLRVEYLHYDFGDTTVSVQPAPAVVTQPLARTNINLTERVDVVLGGIAYKF